LSISGTKKQPCSKRWSYFIDFSSSALFAGPLLILAVVVYWFRHQIGLPPILPTVVSWARYGGVSRCNPCITSKTNTSDRGRGKCQVLGHHHHHASNKGKTQYTTSRFYSGFAEPVNAFIASKQAPAVVVVARAAAMLAYHNITLFYTCSFPAQIFILHTTTTPGTTTTTTNTTCD
jgi:hypothetical protein